MRDAMVTTHPGALPRSAWIQDKLLMGLSPRELSLIHI